MRLVTLGPKATHSHHAATIAAARLRGTHGEIDIRFADTNVDVLKGTTEAQCLGVVPIETAEDGLVKPVFREFWLQHRKNPIYVIGEVQVPISHHWLVHRSKKLLQPMDFERVCSHPEALKQCKRKMTGLGIDPDLYAPTNSTAEAARMVAEIGDQPQRFAALASRFAAETYDLYILREHMEDSNGNATRFHILGPMPMEPTGRDRTAMIFTVPDKPGRAAYAQLAIAAENVNMTSLHSIPLGVFGESAIYIEAEFHQNTEIGHNILKRMETYVDELLVLGSYPQSAPELH